jgi:NAD+ synthase
MKSQVYALAKEVGVIDLLLNAKPTDGLFADGRTDEDQIGATYEELERVMECSNPLELIGRELEVYKIYENYHRKNYHKMIPIPVYKK